MATLSLAIWSRIYELRIMASYDIKNGRDYILFLRDADADNHESEVKTIFANKLPDKLEGPSLKVRN